MEILGQLQSLQHSVITQCGELQTSINKIRMEMNTKNKILTRNINRLVVQPSRKATPQQREHNNIQSEVAELQQTVHDNNTNNVGFLAELCLCPRTLYDLWQEYQYGLGGRKPAKYFTPTERGKVKHKYSRRKVVWETIT
mgnify:FL=1